MKTPWFDATDVSPVHAGEYEYEFAGIPAIYRFMWVGGRWRWRDGDVLHPMLGDKWRGLAEPPK